jgi:hypothetical protein
LSLSTLLVGGGCTTTLIPPPAPAEPVSVYVTDYGRHSSILLPDPRGHLTEYAFGDWNWFALRQTDSGNGARALLFSKYSALGRRQLNVDDRDNIDHISAATKAGKVVKLEVSRARVEALLRGLDDFYDHYLDTVTYAPSSGLWFVRYRGDYHLCHNCNHVTAQWLRELGCEVRGSAMFSKFIVRPPNDSPRSTTAPSAIAGCHESRDSGEKLENRITYGRAGGR